MAVLAGLATCAALPAQQRGKVEFEVVSIKPADPSNPAHSTRAVRGGFSGQNLRLFELILSAWRIHRDQLAGGPNWLETAGWDIEARSPAAADPAQLTQMMQAMLADRFHLVTHRETRTMAIYTLAVAKGGLRLQAGNGQKTISAGPRLIRYGSGTMSELAGQLTSYLGREVIDRTGVAGEYKIDLSFAPVDPGVKTSDAQATPSLFQALREQAGLKLESTKGPVEILVIDRAEKPTAN